MPQIRKIIAQSTVDGPGNRTAIFLQGCNIRCAYCHNPETQPLTIAASEETCRLRDADEVAAEVLRNMPFIRGITVSGGECMLQAEFLTELFTLLKPYGLSLLLDSNGTIPCQRYPRLMSLTDGVMLDVKAWDEAVYERLTGGENNHIVRENLHYLLNENKLTEVRIVCLPLSSPIQTDVENILSHLAQIPDFIDKHIPVRLLRFRPNGVVGTLSAVNPTSDEEMQRYYAYAQSLGLSCTIR